MNSRTFIKLEEIRVKALELQQKGIIKKSTERFFLQNYEQLREEIEFYRTSRIEISDPNLIQTHKHIVILSAILDRMEKIDRVDDDYNSYLLELLNKLGNFSEIDLWLIKLDGGRGLSPYCYPFIMPNKLSFILILPTAPNYFSRSLIGLLAHEASHINESIRNLNLSKKREKRKVSESLADLLGFMMTNSLFLHSANHLIKDIIGIDNSANIRPRHLSWIARMLVLNYLNKHIWRNISVSEMNEKYLMDLQQEFQRISQIEDSVITKSIREGMGKIPDFTKFKINENVLIDIRNLSPAEVSRSEKIMQFIQDIWVAE